MRYLCLIAGLSALLPAVGCGDDDAMTGDSGMACRMTCYRTCTDFFEVSCDDSCPAGSSETMPAGCEELDAGSTDAGVEPPGELVAVDLCENIDGSATVAVSPDGASVAYIMCDGGGGAGNVFVQSLGDRTTTEIGPGAVNFELGWSQDSQFLLFGGDGTFHVRIADASADAVRLSADPVVEWRFIEIDPSSADDDEYLAILYSTRSAGGIVSIAVRDLATLTTERILASDAMLETSLDLVSNTGQNIMVGLVEAGGAVRFQKLTTEMVGIAMPLPFVRGDWSLIAPGLGNTHGSAHTGTGGFGFRILETDTELNEFVASGVNPTHPVLLQRDGTGSQFLHFVVDGNPSRHARSATSGTTETLATANARDLLLSPDQARIVYPDADNLFSVPADGAAPAVEIIPHFGSATDGDFVISPDSTEVAVAADGEVRRGPADTADASEMVDGPDVQPESIGHNGTGRQLVWTRATDEMGRTDVLRSVSVGMTGMASTSAWDVTDWWPVPGAADVLYLSGSALRSLPL